MYICLLCVREPVITAKIPNLLYYHFMAQKIRIKDIAESAKVSPGTVDRVLHNRGNVSEKARKAVEDALARFNYRPNIHMSAISLRKKYRIIVTIPEFRDGDYWSGIHKGILRAITEFDGLDIDCKFIFYDQFDLYSCKKAFRKVKASDCEAVIIGPTFRDETINLAYVLEDKGIPYVFVDSMIEGTSPIAFFSSDQYKCGYLISKLLTSICPEGSQFALFQAIRLGDNSSNVVILRKAGFNSYCEEHGIEDSVKQVMFSVVDPEKNEELIDGFFEKNPEVKGVAVLTARGHIIADFMRKHEIRNVKLVGLDLTKNNLRAIQSGEMDFVIAQRPGQQGFLAVKTLIKYLVYGGKPQRDNYLPLDIITRENVEYYSEFPEASV